MNRNGRKKALSFHYGLQGRVAQTMGSEENVRVYKPTMEKMVELLPNNKSGMQYTRSGTDCSKATPAPKKSQTRMGQKIELSKSFDKKMAHAGITPIDQRIMMTNKACHVVPDHQDFGQHTENKTANGGNVGIDVVETGLTKYQGLLLEQYGFDLVVPQEVKDLKATNAATNELPKKQNSSSQYPNPDMTLTDTDGTPWMNVDNVEDIEQFLKEGKPFKNYNPKKVRIAETPRVKVVAEKYSKIKKNQLELRKLEEKIVCVEYDVFDKELGHFAKPVQVMRAFFSIKTGCELCNGEKMLQAIPITLKEQLDIKGDVKKITEKEIEVIDEKIAENKPYLEDLKKVLRKKLVINDMKKKSTLDLMCMYEMAKRDHAPLDHDFSNTNLLSLAELEEIKELILKRCDAGGYGISRRTLTADSNMHSDSVFYQMLADMKLSSRQA